MGEGKIIKSHGPNHSKLDVTIEKIVSDKNGRYILSEALIDGDKFVFLNDQTQQVQFLRDLLLS